jgi:hypothetical protein
MLLYVEYAYMKWDSRILHELILHPEYKAVYETRLRNINIVFVSGTLDIQNLLANGSASFNR